MRSFPAISLNNSDIVEKLGQATPITGRQGYPVADESRII